MTQNVPDSITYRTATLNTPRATYVWSSWSYFDMDRQRFLFSCIYLLPLLELVLPYVHIVDPHPSGHLKPLGHHRPPIGGIDVLTSFPDPKDFYENFVKASRPALFRGILENGFLPAYKLWNDEYLRWVASNQFELTHSQDNVIQTFSKICDSTETIKKPLGLTISRRSWVYYLDSPTAWSLTRKLFRITLTLNTSLTFAAKIVSYDVDFEYQLDFRREDYDIWPWLWIPAWPRNCFTWPWI